MWELPCLYRSKQSLSDIVADLGRPVTLRYCSNSNNPIREEQLPLQLDLDEAVANIKAVQAAQHSGMHVEMRSEAVDDPA